MRETDPLSIYSTGLGDDEPLGGTPRYCSIADWVRLSGMSRSVTYEALGADKIKAVKLGVKTLIDVRSGLAYLRSLPRAEISTGRHRRAAGAGDTP
jgi:hypothetical protein